MFQATIIGNSMIVTGPPDKLELIAAQINANMQQHQHQPVAPTMPNYYGQPQGGYQLNAVDEEEPPFPDEAEQWAAVFESGGSPCLRSGR